MAWKYSALHLTYNLRVELFTKDAMAWESQCFILSILFASGILWMLWYGKVSALYFSI